MTREETLEALNKDEIKPRELKALLSARQDGVVDFVLLDMRVADKHRSGRIKTTNARVDDMMDVQLLGISCQMPVVLYCQAGLKSKALQKTLKTKGFERVCNLAYGILAYQGELEHD